MLICYCIDGSLKFEIILEFLGDHFESNTRVIFHAKHADTKGPGNIIIQSDETDIFIMLVANVQKLSQSHLGLIHGLDLITLATMLIYSNYLKNLIV